MGNLRACDNALHYIQVMFRQRLKQSFIAIGILWLIAGATAAETDRWRSVDDRLEVAQYSSVLDSASADSAVTIVRADPRIWELRIHCRVNATDSLNLTARQWCEKQNLIAAVNAGMFQQDYQTHVGYLNVDGKVLARRTKSYQSAAAFGPKCDSLPPFRLFDLDKDSLSEIVKNYDNVCQNLRLISRDRSNKWSQQERRWTEVALGEDDKGRVLFIFCNRAMTMHDFNRLLLSLPIGLVAAQHLEGGPEAQLYLKSGELEIERLGTFESGFNESYENRFAYPIPNIIGIAKKR